MISTGILAVILLSLPARLGAEQVTTTSVLPAPLGVFKNIRVTQDAWLAINLGNVGIGTTAPIDKLHVFGGLQVNNGTSGFYAAPGAGFAEIGYVDVVGNRRQNVMKLKGNDLYIPAGRLGIGTENPAVSLHINNGDLQLDDNSGLGKGVILGSGERPMMTRSLDLFTSGSYDGIGRWGLFKEANALTIGIPNITAPMKSVKVRSFDANSSGNDLMTIQANGTVGIGTASPTAKLQVAGGNAYISGAGNGVILKSPNGAVCRRIGIDNSGNITATPVPCP